MMTDTPRPIETAPAEARILVWAEGWQQWFLCEWSDWPVPHWQPEFAEVPMLYEPDDQVTHWLPLPERP